MSGLFVNVLLFIRNVLYMLNKIVMILQNYCNAADMGGFIIVETLIANTQVFFSTLHASFDFTKENTVHNKCINMHLRTPLLRILWSLLCGQSIISGTIVVPSISASERFNDRPETAGNS